MCEYIGSRHIHAGDRAGVIGIICGRGRRNRAEDRVDARGAIHSHGRRNRANNRVDARGNKHGRGRRNRAGDTVDARGAIHRRGRRNRVGDRVGSRGTWRGDLSVDVRFLIAVWAELGGGRTGAITCNSSLQRSAMDQYSVVREGSSAITVKGNLQGGTGDHGWGLNGAVGDSSRLKCGCRRAGGDRHAVLA